MFRPHLKILPKKDPKYFISLIIAIKCKHFRYKTQFFNTISQEK